MKKKIATGICALALLSTSGVSLAAMESDTANYSLTLVDGCAIDSTGATTDFGTFPVDSPQLLGVSAGSITVNCTAGTPYMVGMDDGLYGLGSPYLREPISFTDVGYIIYYGPDPLGDTGMNGVDPGYTESNFGQAISGIGTSTPTTYPLTADVFLDPMWILPPGDYSDTVTFTVVW